MRSVRRSMRLRASVLASRLPAAAIRRRGREPHVERDVVFDERSGLAMDVYRPLGDRSPAPGVLLLHGGAFIRGDKSATASIASVLAAVGYLVFSANYVLIRDYVPVATGIDRYWEAVDGVERALRFTWEGARRLGLDTRRVAAFGISAGGTFAAMLGWRGVAGRRDRMPVRAVVSWSGALDLYRGLRFPSAEATALVASLPPGYTADVDAHREALDRASPLAYLGPDSAPTMLVNAREDLVPLAVAREAAGRLARAGVPHELVVHRRGHALGYARRTIAPTLRFLDRYLWDVGNADP